MRGGKRSGAGRPPGSTVKTEDQKAKRVNTTMAPDLIAWLDEMKDKGYSKARVIDKALREFMARWGG